MVFSLVRHAIEIYSYVVLAAVVASWVAPGSRHPVVRILERVTEPVLEPIRRVIPPMGGFDLSPLALLLGLRLLSRLF